MSEPKRRLVNLFFRDTSALKASFMPFVSHGALFVQAHDAPMLDDPITLLIHLPGGGAPSIAEGKVIWITPEGVQGNQPPGFGVQLKADDSALLQRIVSLVNEARERTAISFTI